LAFIGLFESSCDGMGTMLASSGGCSRARH
jgi:hypothetical protein